ncbi:hypothetical protein CTTA_0220 [Comamonas testosteroni]|uniref:Uncharacterized protein n=1 Tax=Comamonas testosteroni TaxID=285 RepID=A0A5A7M921_COMTE|nr:SIR2 family protein [Comamonas testosteroni]GEQ73215.1 hypothetical protein CTTA_0220 [Comamonas testosteroni]
MNLKDKIDQVESYGPSGYFLIERLIFGILKLESRHIIYEPTNNKLSKNIYYDAYCDKNFLDIEGPFVIDFKLSLNKKSYDESISRHFKFFIQGDTPGVTKRKNLLIITTRNLSNVPRQKEFFIGGSGSAQVYVWGIEDIQKIADKHSGKMDEVLNAQLSSRFSHVEEKGLPDWKDVRKNTIEEISKKYHSGHFSLFLGAGVSSSAGLPDWDTLLNSLFVSMLITAETERDKIKEKTLRSIVDRLREIDGPSSIALARYLRKGITGSSAQEKFNEELTRTLYELRNTGVDVSSSLIREIANLCVPSRLGAKVKSVITYNFDDLFERELKSKGLHHKSIYEEMDLPSSEELPVYHVHGFLPENRKEYPSIDRSTLVFSEEGYHKIYNESYHWSNLIQLNNLKENSCLMIGLSLTDPNLRRLLEIARKSTENAKHFAFMRRVDENKFIEGSEDLVNGQKEVKKFLINHHALNEQVMQELGVNIIWFEDFDDIPEIIKQIKSYKSA